MLELKLSTGKPFKSNTTLQKNPQSTFKDLSLVVSWLKTYLLFDPWRQLDRQSKTQNATDLINNEFKSETRKMLRNDLSLHISKNGILDWRLIADQLPKKQHFVSSMLESLENCFKNNTNTKKGAPIITSNGTRTRIQQMIK